MRREKEIGRFLIFINPNGAHDHSYGYGVDFSVNEGWNDEARRISFHLSVNELRDIQYMIGELLRGVD